MISGSKPRGFTLRPLMGSACLSSFCGRVSVVLWNIYRFAQGVSGIRLERIEFPATLVYMSLTTLELCAGGGGQALGLEMAGFHHSAVVEYEPQFCTTLRKNRPHWDVRQTDIRNLDGKEFSGVDVVAGGVPCPPFSVAGKQLGENDERDMFPAAMEIIRKAKPRAVMLENVQGLATAKFEDYRKGLLRTLEKMGYQPDWRVLQASDFGVSQLRPRFILVALRPKDMEHFHWPAGARGDQTVGNTLIDLMAENGWLGAENWAAKAADIAPTVVGGSKKHGGPDLGPTRAKAQWRALSVDGMGIANAAPGPDAEYDHVPRLTVRMVARIQSFPDSWDFTGGKTAAYRQVGNAFPPNVAKYVGFAIKAALARQSLNIGYTPEPISQLKLLEEPTIYRAKVRKRA